MGRLRGCWVCIASPPGLQQRRRSDRGSGLRRSFGWLDTLVALRARRCRWLRQPGWLLPANGQGGRRLLCQVSVRIPKQSPFFSCFGDLARFCCPWNGLLSCCYVCIFHDARKCSKCNAVMFFLLQLAVALFSGQLHDCCRSDRFLKYDVLQRHAWERTHKILMGK